MRLIVAGQRSFGAAVLTAALDAGHDIAAVVAPPDSDDPLRAAAWRAGYADLTYDRATPLLGKGVDLIVGAHSHAYVGRKSRGSTKLGAIGYHPSLLPRHRGRDAVRWTVAMGDPIAGGSVYWFTDGVDTGPIAAQDWVFVDRAETAGELWRDKLFPLGVELLIAVLKDLDNGLVVQVPQQDRYSSWEPSWHRPPLHRPELPELGPGPSGFEVTADPSALSPHRSAR